MEQSGYTSDSQPLQEREDWCSGQLESLNIPKMLQQTYPKHGKNYHAERSMIKELAPNQLLNYNIDWPAGINFAHVTSFPPELWMSDNNVIMVSDVK